MEAMQYKDFVKNINENPIRAQSDDTVQKAVYDWFKYRYIGFSDPDKFLDILQRNVAINYPIYQQKLRIEPGVSQYDWLVQTYHERQLKTVGQSETGVEYGGTTTDTKTGDEINTKTGSQDSIRTGGQTSVRSGSDEIAKSGGHTTEDVKGKHTQTTSPHVQRVTKTDNDRNGWSGDSQLQAQNPMSESYDKFIEPDASDAAAGQKQYYEKAYQHMPALDWHNVSSQGQSGHREYGTEDNTVTESYKYGDGVKGDIVTDEGDSKNPDKSTLTYNDEKDTHTYNDITDKTTYDSVHDQTTYNSITDTHTYNGVTDVSKHTGKDTTTGSDNRTDREQMTGRSEAPADILARASAWIEQSSAFKWFKEQIDPCFKPWYDEDGGLI